MKRVIPAWALLVAFALLVAACSTGASTTSVTIPTSDGPDPGSPATVEGDSPDESTSTAGVEDLTIRGETSAPDFPPGLDWLNVDRPLTIEQDLQGKFVVLDFWTQGCINCIHLIPELKQLEDEFGDALAVVGVHWAKFDRERQTAAIRDSVVRYGVEHPVVNDEFETIRSAYGVQAWPTIVLIDPAGNVIGSQSGEGVYDVLAPLLERGTREWSAAGLLDETPLATVLTQEAAPQTVLSFPGKVLADEATNRLFVADTGHHRILVSNLAGELEFAIGSGLEGFDDATFADATFASPQGMALSADGTILYVADRGNHAIRSIDLDTRTVTTIAGTGQNTFRVIPGDAATSALSSPWDLHLFEDQLFIAGAGRHQLWVVDLSTGELDIFAGTGAEGLTNGPRLNTTLSQPSGFADDGEMLYFTDPEASAIRSLPLDGTGELVTIVGDGLFTWGDVNGSFGETLLQHAVGIEYYNGRLIVADTYNHQLKILELDTRRSVNWVGANEAGYVDLTGADARLAEPSGLSIAGNFVYVADTNNHQIRRVDLARATTATVAFTNLEVAALRNGDRLADEVTLPLQTIEAGDATIQIEFDLPEGYKWNTGGTFTMEWTATDSQVATPSGPALYEANGPETPVVFELIASPGTTDISIESTVYYCLDDNEAFCLIRDVSFLLPVEVGSGSSEIVASHSLPSAERLESL